MTAVATAPAAQVTPDRLMQISWGYAAPLILEAAIRRRVFDVLDSGPKTVAELQAETGSSARGLAAIANVLAALNFLSKDDAGRFSLTPESAAFLVSGKPDYMGSLLLHVGGRLIPAWLNLSEIVAAGAPAKPVNQEDTGSAFFEDFVLDIFPLSYPAAKALAAYFQLDSATAPVSVLDIAAGSGVWGIALAQSSPQVHVTAVDWPGVLPVTEKNVARYGLSDRFSFTPGDLSSADFGLAYQIATLGHILHSEGEARSRSLLSKVFDALAPGGTIVIAEFLVNKDRTGPMIGLLFAINMLVSTAVGDTWSFEEISEWLTEAGFVNPRTLDAPGPSPLILATRP
jgi:3-hydroxy-5-methyl-1-naphthoate 3-O-methyltransferase